MMYDLYEGGVWKKEQFFLNEHEAQQFCDTYGFVGIPRLE